MQALVREDGLTQVEAAELLGRHKSWVCRRLALLETAVCSEAQADLRLGLLSAGLARQLTRLPAGNQAAVLTAARRESLTTVEVQGVIDLLRGATPEQEALRVAGAAAALLQAKACQAGARSASEPGGQSAGPATAASCSICWPPGELATSSRPGRIDARGSPAAGAALRASGPRCADRRGPGGGSVASRNSWEEAA